MTSTTAPAPRAVPTAAPTDRRRAPDPRLHLGRRSPARVLVAHVLPSVGLVRHRRIRAVPGSVRPRPLPTRTLAQSLARTVETSLWLSVPPAVVSGLTGIVLGLGTPVGTRQALVGRPQGDRLRPADPHRPARRSGRPCTKLASGNFSGRLLDPAIGTLRAARAGHVVSVVKPFGRTPRGQRGLPSRA